MKSLDKIAIAFLAIFLLSGCSSSHHKPQEVTGGMHSGFESSLAGDFERNAGDRVFFDYDSSTLSHHAKEKLDIQVHWLKDHPHVKATIEGHCDERGTEEYNMALAERRAEATKHYLISKGIASHRLDTISYGKSRPAVIGNNEEAWKNNRRTVTSVR